MSSLPNVGDDDDDIEERNDLVSDILNIKLLESLVDEIRGRVVI